MTKPSVFVYFSTFLFIALVSLSCKKEDDNPVSGTEPAVPTLASPANGATNQSASLTLTWNASEGAASYSLQVSTSTSFSPATYDQDGLTVTSQTVSGLSSATTYYWRVRATNSAGTSGWSSPPWAFRTGSGGVLPTVTTSPVSGVTSNSASCGGNVLSQGSAPVTARGVCWSTVQGPTIADNVTVDGSGTGSYSSSIAGLSTSTRYYVRAYATTSAGTSYGTQESFMTVGSAGTPCPGTPTVTYAGKTYNTIQIGGQCWMKENLDVGSMIPGTQDQANNSSIEKYCYNNSPANCNTYGGLYQWNEAMQYSNTPAGRGICPPGWHIPMLDEFLALRTFVGSSGNALKEVGQGIGGGAGTNTSGFSALLAGYRNPGGTFQNQTGNTFFWTSTQDGPSYARDIFLSGSSNLFALGSELNGNGYSIRCLRD